MNTVGDPQDGGENSGATDRFSKVSRYTLEPSAKALVTLREFMKATLGRVEAVEPHLCDVVFATHEACKNSVSHNPGMKEPVDVTCRIAGDSLVVEIADRGSGFDPSLLPPARPDPECSAGRGLYLIYSLMDQVEAEFDGGGTVMRLRKRLR